MPSNSSDCNKILAESFGVATETQREELPAEPEEARQAARPSKSGHASTNTAARSSPLAAYFDDGPLSLTQMADLDQQMAALLMQPDLRLAFGFAKLIPNRLVTVRRRARLALNEVRLPMNEGIFVPWLLLARVELDTFVPAAPEIGDLPECVLREPSAVTARRLWGLVSEARRLFRCYGLENLYQAARRCLNADPFEVAPTRMWFEAVIALLCGLAHLVRCKPEELPNILACHAQIEAAWRSVSQRTLQDAPHDMMAMAQVEHFAERWGRPPTQQDFEWKAEELHGVAEKVVRGILPEHVPAFFQAFVQFETHPLVAVLPAKLLELLEEFDGGQAVASLKEEFFLVDRTLERPASADDPAETRADTPEENAAAPAGENERKFMEMAIEEARKSVGEDGRAHPKVGALVVRDGIVRASAHRGELGEGEHAEYTSLERKLPDEFVTGATVYTTLEPCTTRNHPKIPCAKRLIKRRVRRVVIGMLDPNPAICGKGERLLRDHGIVVDRFPNDLIVQLEELNRDFTRAQSQAAEGEMT